LFQDQSTKKNPFENIKSSWEQLWDVITIDDWFVPGTSALKTPKRSWSFHILQNFVSYPCS
jgi:hypothetical protein